MRWIEQGSTRALIPTYTAVSIELTVVVLLTPYIDSPRLTGTGGAVGIVLIVAFVVYSGSVDSSSLPSRSGRTRGKLGPWMQTQNKIGNFSHR